MEMGDAEAMFNLGYYYSEGMAGLTQDWDKALEHWHRSGELGHAGALNNLGTAYFFGRGVKKNEKKAMHYYELAAMRGDENARYNLGKIEWYAGNTS